MTDLLALLGSRICHDLVNPLGAIGNGVELMELSGSGGPELELVKSAVDAAQARLRFFRVAFGAAAPGHEIAEAEIRAILSGITRETRLSVDWQAIGPVPRIEARLAFLGLLCAESAMPFGGTVVVEPGWTIAAAEPRVAADPALWSCLNGGPAPDDMTGGQVHYALLARAATEAGRRVEADTGPGHLRIAL